MSQEENVKTETRHAPFTLQEVEEALKAGGGAMGEILRSEEVSFTDDAWEAAFQVYDRALGNGKCPCGSGRAYGDCCRPFWRFATTARKRDARGIAQAVEQEKAEARESAREADLLVEMLEKRVGEEVDFNVRVGVGRKSGVVYVMPYKRGVPMEMLVDMLLLGYNRLSQERMERYVVGLLKRAMGGEPEQEGKIVKPGN